MSVERTDHQISADLQSAINEINQLVQEAVAKGLKVEFSEFDIGTIADPLPVPIMQVRVLRPIWNADHGC